MRKSIIANTAMASRLAAMKIGDTCAVWEIVKPQPVIRKFVGNITNKKVRGWHIPGTNVFWKKDDTPDCSLIPDIIPLAIGHQLYVREPWCDYNQSYIPALREEHPVYLYVDTFDDACGKGVVTSIFSSPATMPRTAARTFLTPTEVVCVRVKEVEIDTYKSLIEGNGGTNEYKDYLKPNDYPYLNAYNSWGTLVISRYGQAAWDNNSWIWITTLKKTEKI